MSIEKNKMFAERAIMAWNQGEQAYSDWITEAVAPSVRMHVPQGELSGEDMFRAYFHEIRSAFPDGHASIDEVTADGNTIVVRYTFQGTNSGKLLTMPVTTGNSASFTVVDAWHLADGKAVEFWETYDRYGMLEQLGLVREPTVSVP